MQESMGQLTQMRSDHEMEEQLQQASHRIHQTALELLHHTVLLGDELGVTEKNWPEAPIDRGRWHRKLRVLMAHITCGDDCPVSKVCECLGQMVYMARHALTMGEEFDLQDALTELEDSDDDEN